MNKIKETSMLRIAESLIKELMRADKKELLAFMLLTEDNILGMIEADDITCFNELNGCPNIYERLNNEILFLGAYFDRQELEVFLAGQKMQNWLNAFYGLNKEKQEAIYGAILILCDFINYKNVEAYLEESAKRDIEVNDLLNLLFECYAR